MSMYTQGFTPGASARVKNEKREPGIPAGGKGDCSVLLCITSEPAETLQLSPLVSQ
jgi:hypothetical protein